MRQRVGSNDPCPCGSGKKYKRCHLGAPALASVAPPAKPHAGAFERALKWLVSRHRKEFEAAVDDLLEDLRPEREDVAQTVPALPQGVAESIQLSLAEWLLADGDMEVQKGSWEPINAYLLDAQGTGLTGAQRNWLAQLGSRPLRLYTVTDVRPGIGLTLCDALDADATPLDVLERAGSQHVMPGMLLGCRVMEVEDHLELSGAVCAFTHLQEAGVRYAVHAVQSDASVRPDDLPWLTGLAILRAWVLQWILPPPIPEIVDAATGEPVVLVTDHYRVVDADALRQAMDQCDDVVGDAKNGWAREFKDADGAKRSLAAINPGQQSERIEIFYRTQRHADEGRPWFEGAAGSSVQFLTREISDPKGFLSKPDQDSEPRSPTSSLSPEVTAAAIEEAVLRSYANWADEPIPALSGKTPRQAIGTAAGLERVKGLLRSYEAGEARMAAQGKRRPISYQFLWDVLGIAR